MFAQGRSALAGLGAGQWGVFQHQCTQHPLTSGAHKPGIGNRKFVLRAYICAEKFRNVLLCKGSCKTNAPARCGSVHLCHGKKGLAGKRVVAGKLRGTATAQQKRCGGRKGIAGGVLLLILKPHGYLFWPCNSNEPPHVRGLGKGSA